MEDQAVRTSRRRPARDGPVRRAVRAARQGGDSAPGLAYRYERLRRGGRSRPQDPALSGMGKHYHLREPDTAKSSIKASKLQHRVTRTRVKDSKLLEFRRLQRPLWIRRVLVR